MLCLLLLVLPFYHAFTALAARLPRARAAGVAAAALAAALLAFWRLGGAVPGIPPGRGLLTMSMLEVGAGLGWAGMMGRWPGGIAC